MLLKSPRSRYCSQPNRLYPLAFLINDERRTPISINKTMLDKLSVRLEKRTRDGDRDANVCFCARHCTNGEWHLLCVSQGIPRLAFNQLCEYMEIHLRSRSIFNDSVGQRSEAISFIYPPRRCGGRIGSTTNTAKRAPSIGLIFGP